MKTDTKIKLNEKLSYRLREVLSRYIKVGVRFEFEHLKLSFLKEALLHDRFFGRDRIVKCGNSKLLKTYDRVVKDKTSLVAHIINTKGSEEGCNTLTSNAEYTIMVTKGKRNYFIFVSYGDSQFLKVFGKENSITLWDVNKSNVDWIKKHPELVIDNPEEWTKLQSYVTALGLSKGEI